MVILEDTRQQSGKHDTLHKSFEEMGVEVVRCKLPFGDYAVWGRKEVVDTKASLHEITQNLCGPIKERARFINECKLAKRCGGALVFLIETGAYESPSDLIGHEILLLSGKRIPGIQLFRAMSATSEYYGCRFEFSDKKKTGQRIVEIFTNG